MSSVWPIRRCPRPFRYGTATLLLVAVMGSLIVACDGSGDAPAAAAGTRPLAEILDGGLAIVDLTPERAALQVATTVPVVCSVVYGTDTSYGAQSTDSDMMGGPHRDHLAPLRGLEPDTEYHYRVQGSAADGTIYVSEDRTFRTPPAEEVEELAAGAAQERSNLASLDAGAQVVAVSSAFGGSMMWRGENAIDGDGLTEWSSQGDGNDAFITIQLPEPATVTGIALWTRTMGASAEIRSFQVVTEDETVLGPFILEDAAQLHEFTVDPVVAQTLRFEVVESSGGNVGIVELAVYGE